jgi:type III restriction enzyme
MSERAVHSIAGRLSLRPPQRESLGLLHDIVEVLNPHERAERGGSADASSRQAFPNLLEKGFEDFEREFPSFCFGTCHRCRQDAAHGGVHQPTW